MAKISLSDVLELSMSERIQLVDCKVRRRDPDDRLSGRNGQVAAPVPGGPESKVTQVLPGRERGSDHSAGCDRHHGYRQAVLGLDATMLK